MKAFMDRVEAGRLLGQRLATLKPVDPVVLALPRGGVPVAVEVARALRAPLDLLMVLKIGAPGQREVAVAAVVDGDHPEIVVDEETLSLSGADRAYVDAEAAHELKEIERRRALYLRGRGPVLLDGKSVVLVDDGIATGTTVHAEVDDLVCLSQPESHRPELHWRLRAGRTKAPCSGRRFCPRTRRRSLQSR